MQNVCSLYEIRSLRRLVRSVKSHVRFRLRGRYRLCKFSAFIVAFFLIFNGSIHRFFQPGTERIRFVQATNFIGKSKCKLPILPLNDPDIMKYIKHVDPNECVSGSQSQHYQQDWVVVNGTHAEITQKAKAHFGEIKCNFSDIIRVNDFEARVSTNPVVGQVFQFINSDFIHVSCESAAHTKRWNSFLATPRSNIKIRKISDSESKSKVANKLNVLMLGHDSLSRNMFIRKLPLTFAYLTKKLDGVILKGYNIVGDGTTKAIIPILTGNHEHELPDARQSVANASYVDEFPFVWKEFKNQGYTTGYLEDSPQLGVFQYRLRGFNKIPTDFFMRPYFIAAQKHYLGFPPFCIGSVPRHRIMTNYIKHIMNYKEQIPKFLFSFHSELSHGSINNIQGADRDMTNFLQDLHESSVLNNTILVIFSDHGSRFSIIRLDAKND